ncbi:hypothetical protein JW926_09065 [Candidatus Sumerlaeota bacterium]|nr:hypothetical protein [Candidatus Sumerlaeota bacterium]
MKKTVFLTICCFCLTFFVYAQTNPYGYTEGAQIFSETFDTAASLSNFTQSGTGNYTIEWLDYTGKKVYGGSGNTGCEDLSGTTFTDSDIGVAPNTGDASKNAIRMIVNPSTITPAIQSVANIYTNTAFSGDYRVYVDMFFRVNGPPDDGGTGSTENGIVGVNHGGAKIINQQQDGDSQNPTDTDGYFFILNGERGTGATGDACLFEGDPAAQDVAKYLVNVLPCGDVDPATVIGSGLGITDNNEWLNFMPYGVDKYRYRGAPGDSWITFIMDSLTIESEHITIVYINNGTEVKEITRYSDADATYASGKILLGYEDRFTSSNAPEESYLIFDNLKVCSLDAPPPTPTPIPPLNVDSPWSLYE